MATGIRSPLPQRVSTPIVKIENADGTTSFTILTVGANDPGYVIEALNCSTSDTTGALEVILSVTDGADEIDIIAVTLPATAGTDGTTASINLLESLLEAWNSRTALIGPGTTLKVRTSAAVESAKFVGIYCEAWDYDDGA